MAEKQAVDLSILATFLERHDMGVDDLFFVIHLGAQQLSRKADIPAPVRQHWTRIAEECHSLWHNTQRDGRPVE